MSGGAARRSPRRRLIRIDVVLTAEAVPTDGLQASTVLVVDVLRASTTIITALANGAEAIIPAVDAEEARRRAGALAGGALVAGERHGQRITGFELGNSPLEFASERVRGRTVIFTTSNGTRALLASRQAAAVGIAGLVNASAAAAWAEAERRDLVVICAGERGAVSLEDHVCAGLLVARVRLRAGETALTAAAATAAEVARAYDGNVAGIARDSRWARHLAAAGFGRDVTACLALDTTSLVPRYLADIDKVVLGPR